MFSIGLVLFVVGFIFAIAWQFESSRREQAAWWVLRGGIALMLASVVVMSWEVLP